MRIIVTFAYDHIIWDWNGTLFDDAWLCVDIMNGLLTRRGLPGMTPERYETIFDFPVEDYYRRAGFDFDVDPFLKLSDEFMGPYRVRTAECGLRGDTREALERARALGVTQSILSAMEQVQIEGLLARFGLRSYFTDVVGLGDQHARGKLDVGRRWLAGQRLAPERMIFVGDTTHDYDVAQALGVACVLIHSGHHSRARLEAVGAPVIGTLMELFEIPGQ